MYTELTCIPDLGLSVDIKGKGTLASPYPQIYEPKNNASILIVVFLINQVRLIKTGKPFDRKQELCNTLVDDMVSLDLSFNKSVVDDFVC